jgi:hypothetical protein
VTRKYVKWSDSLMLEFKKHWDEGKLSMAQMSKLLGPTENALAGKADRMGWDKSRGGRNKPPVFIQAEDRPRPEIVRLPVPTPPVVTFNSYTRTCQFLNGPPEKLDFCDKPSQANSVYCPDHYAICYVPIHRMRKGAA